MAQQYSYGYGYGYGYGTPNPYMAAQMPVATPQMPVATPQMPVAAVVTQAPTPAVGYSPYQTQVVPAASRPPLPAAPTPAATPYYQAAAAVAANNTQQAAAYAASYYGYQQQANPYGSYYAAQQQSTLPRPPAPTSYTAPTYTPSTSYTPTVSTPVTSYAPPTYTSYTSPAPTPSTSYTRPSYTPSTSYTRPPYTPSTSYTPAPTPNTSYTAPTPSTSYTRPAPTPSTSYTRPPYTPNTSYTRPPYTPSTNYTRPPYTPSTNYTPPRATNYTRPSYTPSPITQQAYTPTTTTPSLVSYPASMRTAYKPAQTFQSNFVTPGGGNYSGPQKSSDNLTPQQTNVVKQYVDSKTKPSKGPAWWDKKPTGTGQEHYCVVCKISTASAQTHKAHLEGKHHKKKLAQQLAIKEKDKTSCQFYCELCDIICSNSDSLEAHNRGLKHQKVINLHRRLGKPIPALKIIDNAAGKKVLAGSHQVAFVGGRTLHSTGEVNKPAEVSVYPPTPPTLPKKTPPASANTNGNKKQQDDNQDRAVEPVGEHLVKAVKDDPKFPHAQYKCDMCDCYFNDEYAKKAHISGRRHRTNYKKMYQPDLFVEPTNTEKKQKEKQREREQLMRRGRGHGRGGGGVGRGWSDETDPPLETKQEPSREREDEGGWDGGWDATMNPDPHHDPHDDILVMDRHKLVYPSRAETKAVERVVEEVEKSLKTISDELLAEKAAVVNGSVKDETFRELKGVMRVGVFAHNLLLKGECSAELVLMCDKKPTMTLFNLVINRLAIKFESLLRNSENEIVYNTTPLSGKSMVNIICQVETFRVIVSVVFSSPLMRQEPSALQSQADQTEGVLNRQYCVAALAALRHTKWFKAMSRNTPTAGVVLRVMKDICRRVPAWGVLESWMLELLVEKCALSSHPAYTQPGDLFRRIMECVASGIFLPGGRGLLDPCEKDKMDAAASLSASDRSNVTLSAQHALRLMAIKKLHLVLGVDPLPGDLPEETKPAEGTEVKGDSEGTGVKRPSISDGEGGGAVKKAKLEQ